MPLEKTDPADAFGGPAPMPRFGPFTLRMSTSPGSTVRERAEAAGVIASRVRRLFHVLEENHDESGVYLKVIFDPGDGGRKFELLRRDLKKLRLFPKLVDTGRETVIAVYPLPKRKRSGITANVVMLVLTLFTTVWAGAVLWMSRDSSISSFLDLFTVLFSPEDLLLGGLTFAFPLILILGTHELGHYFTSRRYGIDATLPYFIPIPPFISPFGTFGALISMKEPMSNKKALVEIGAAGPVAGFLVALPVTMIGLILTDVFPSPVDMVEGESYMLINPPLLFQFMANAMGTSSEGAIFPTALAGWIGLFVTALNLFPVGQLDGGHIARGVLGQRAKYLSYATIAAMVILGLLTSFGTYFLFAILILLMGGRHPPPLDDETPIKPRHYITAGIALMIFALTFHPVPLEEYRYASDTLSFGDHEHEEFASPHVPNILSFTVVNEGEGAKEYTLEVYMNGSRVVKSITRVEFGWDDRAYSALVDLSHASFSHGGWHILAMSPLEGTVGRKGTMEANLVAGCSDDVGIGDSIDVELKLIGGKELGSTKLVLKRAECSVSLSASRGAKEGAYLIEMEVGSIEPSSSRANISIDASGDALGWSLEMTRGPVNGTWTLPGEDGRVPVVLNTSGRTLIASVSWDRPIQGSEPRCSLVLEMSPNGDRAPGSVLLGITVSGEKETSLRREVLLPL